MNLLISYCNLYSSLFTIKRRKNEKLEAKDDSPNVSRTQAAERVEEYRFLSLMTLTCHFDLDFQARPSEGPNTSSL